MIAMNFRYEGWKKGAGGKTLLSVMMDCFDDGWLFLVIMFICWCIIIGIAADHYKHDIDSIPIFSKKIKRGSKENSEFVERILN